MSRIFDETFRNRRCHHAVGLYASKYYQERTALAEFDGDGRRLVILNPSLLLGPDDERLSSTKLCSIFSRRKYHIHQAAA
jgi:nucleoside-diphosphate-sugar epimerase